MIQNFRLLMLLVCSVFWTCSATAQSLEFQDHSETAGILGNYLNHSASVADFDLDGDLDVYVGSRLAPNTLYRNEGNSTFVPVASGVEDEGFTMATLFFDYDNDGDPDLLSCNSGDANHFWRNDGGGVFTDVTDELGLGQESQCRGAHAADINMDGWLDLYIVNMNQPNAFWLSDGEGGFTDGYFASGATDELIGMGALFIDIENDGDLDLYLTHDGNQTNKLYVNNGEGVFTDQAQAWGLDLQAQGMGVDATDLNHDGFLDLYISNNLPNDLYLNPGVQPDLGTVPFENITDTAGVGNGGMGWGTVFIDHDHDGERDLYVSNEYLFSPIPNLLYHNNGDLTFTDIAEGSPLASPYSGYATVVADFDENGTEDLLVVNTLVSSNPGCQLFLNTDTANHWVGFELEGVLSPRDAAGARVVVHSGLDFHRTDAAFLGYSYSSCGPLTFNFGLGDRTAVDSVEVFWPSGLRTVTLNPAVDQYHTLLETPCFGMSPDLDWPETMQLCPGDAFILSVPDGWTAAGWTLGVDHPDGREISQEGVVQVLLSSGSCSVLSPAVEVVVVEAVPPTILTDGPLRFCQGTLRQLSVPSPQLAVLWSNGIAADILYVGNSDTLTVTTTNVCGHIDTSEPMVIETFESPSAPIVAPALVAAGAAHTFEPIQLEGEALRWYAPYGPNALLDLQQGSTDQVGPFIQESPTYTTPLLGGSTGWWVKAAGMRDDRQATGGKENTTSGGFIGSDAYGLTFDAHEDIVLDRVRVLANASGPRTFQLRSIQAEILMEISQVLVAGWNTVELGFFIAEGTGYALLVSAPDVSLWRDNVGNEQSYPYAIGEMATITNSTIPSAAGANYYYFFYDWEVSSQGVLCESNAAAAYVEVVDVIAGCTYAFAANFDAQASLDDGSCFLQGCIDPSASNFNPLASVDDGTCAVTCDSDLNGDGQIGAPDLLELLSAWGGVCD